MFCRLALVFPLAAIAVGGCASDLAQGYRSTPDYPAYAAASDGQGDGLECALNLGFMAHSRSIEKRFERRFDGNFKSGNPQGEDWLTSLLMSGIFALAEQRSYGPGDACAAAAAADNASRRRNGYPY